MTELLFQRHVTKDGESNPDLPNEFSRWQQVIFDAQRGGQHRRRRRRRRPPRAASSTHHSFGVDAQRRSRRRRRRQEQPGSAPVVDSGAATSLLNKIIPNKLIRFPPKQPKWTKKLSAAPKWKSFRKSFSPKTPFAASSFALRTFHYKPVKKELCWKNLVTSSAAEVFLKKRGIFAFFVSKFLTVLFDAKDA